MRYFIGYHNEEKTGLLCTKLPYPRIRTKHSVQGAEGATVWVVAGIGKSPKRYAVTSRFEVEHSNDGKYPATDLPNEASGNGKLFGDTIPIDGTPLLTELKRVTANFVSGFRELHDPRIIEALKVLA